MIKYEVFMYDFCKSEYGAYINDVISTSIIFTDTSKSSICKKLGLNDPYKIDIDVYDADEGIIYVDYEGKPYCELHEID